MALVDMSLGRIQWDDAASSITMEFLGNDQPPPPPLAEGEQWYPGAGTRLTVTVPAKKASTTAATATKVALVNGLIVYTQYTWTGTAWGNPVRVNADGTPWTG